MDFPMFVLAKCGAIAGDIAAAAGLIGPSAAIPAYFFIGWRLIVVTHYGVLAESRKSFFRSLATCFRRQSLSS